MNEITIPTAVNWFNDNIISTTSDGARLAYGSKNEIIVINNLNQDPLDISKYETTTFPIGVKNIITAVRFAPVGSDHTYSDYLASAGNDGKVCLWNLKNSTIVSYHTGHMSPKGNEEIKGMDWSKLDPETIVTVASSGSIVSWKLNVNVINRYSLKGKLSPQCVACCPVNRNLVAIGTKSGLFIVYSLKDSGNILWSLRGHDAEIVSVAWCPENFWTDFKGNQKDEDGKTGPPLVVATASKDCTVTVWRNKVSELTFNLFPASRYNSALGIKHVCICWPTSNTIIAGTHQGDLKLLKLSGDPKTELKGTKTSITDLPVKHNKCIFSLTFNPLQSDAGAGGDATPPITVWSASIDRNIIGFNLNNPKKQIFIPTLTQIAYCMAFNPINNSQLAIGVGNGEVVVWNVSTKNNFDTVCYKSKIMAKVMALAWHPTAENLLAFGTGEGRVGIINTTGKTPPVILKLAHSSSVYTLSWAGPLNFTAEKLKNGLSLYSVGDGDVVEHNPDDPNATPIKLNKVLSAADESFKLSMRFQRTELAWNHDSSAVAVGNENGYVHILDKSWAGLQTIYAHKKIIQSLAWHPKIITDESMAQVTSWKNILATASHQIKVYDFSEGLDKEPKVLVSFAHADECRVTTVAWSPFIPYRLLSTSYDNSAQIWDVLNKTPLANFPGHTGYVMCGLWSPLDNDTVYTGGADCKVFVWKTAAQTHIKPIERKKRKEMINKYQLTNVVEAKYGNVNFNAEPVSPEHCNYVVVEKNKKAVPKLKTLFPLTAAHLSEGKSFGHLISKSKESTNGENGTASEVSYLKFFGDTNDMMSLLNAEQAKHTEMQNLDGEQLCRFWKGDVTALVRDSIHKKQVSEWILSLAPMASYKLWLEACVAYAYQIALEQPLRAASYLVAANEIQEAVNILTGKNMHREAVAMAKCHWSSDDPRLQSLMRSWAEYAASNGHFSLAAHCYYSINDKASAITNILKCKDPKLRYQSAILAEDVSTPLAVDDIITDCFLDCLASNHVVNAASMLGQRAHLNHLAVWLETYKYCSQHIPLDWKMEKAWLAGERKSTPALKDLENMMKDLLGSDTGSVYTKLSKIVDSINVENRNKLIMYVSGQFALLLSSSDTSVRLNHLLNALSSSYKLQVQCPQYHYTLSLFALLRPEGPQTLDVLEQSFSLPLGCANSAVQSLYFYMSAAIIKWLNASINLSNTETVKSADKNKSIEPEVYVSVIKSLKSLLPKISKSDIISHYKENSSTQNASSQVFSFSLSEINGKSENSSVKLNGTEEVDSKRLLQAQFIAVPDPHYILSSLKSTLENSQLSNLIGETDAPKVVAEIDQILKDSLTSPTVETRQN